MKIQIPKLNDGMCAVVFADKTTGILLTNEGSRYLGEGDFYRVFKSGDEAIAFAQLYVQSNPRVECSIRDCEGRHLRFVTC